jgi:uncharacterized protein (TIGR03000 family)
MDSYSAEGLAESRNIDVRMIWADCNLKSGDSGGPLVNTSGEVVGVSQGRPDRARRLSLFIDVAEARDFLGKSDVVQPATVVVHVPANAEVHVEGVFMPSPSGEVRSFVTAPLGIARRYAYQVKATWEMDGQPVTREKRIEFCAGETVHADFLNRE